jgi:hypothetical protein
MDHVPHYRLTVVLPDKQLCMVYKTIPIAEVVIANAKYDRHVLTRLMRNAAVPWQEAAANPDVPLEVGVVVDTNVSLCVIGIRRADQPNTVFNVPAIRLARNIWSFWIVNASDCGLRCGYKTQPLAAFNYKQMPDQLSVVNIRWLKIFRCPRPSDDEDTQLNRIFGALSLAQKRAALRAIEWSDFGPLDGAPSGRCDRKVGAMAAKVEHVSPRPPLPTVDRACTQRVAHSLSK